MLLMFQFMAQLVFVPQEQLYGRLMFVISIAVSWAYNLWLSSFDKEGYHLDMLMGVLRKPRMTKYLFWSRTSMLVFVLLVLTPENPKKTINALLPNESKVWCIFKTAIASQLVDGKPLDLHMSDYNDGTLSEPETTLLEALFRDTELAYQVFAKCQNQGQEPVEGGGIPWGVKRWQASE